MQTTPFLKYTIAGGSEPSTMISMRIFQDGEILVLLENAWPILKNIEEVGVYKFQLSEEKLQQLKQYIKNVKNVKTSYGEKMPGSLRYTLQISDKKIQWDHFATIPTTLDELQNALINCIKDSLTHTYQTLKASFIVSEENASITLQNTGKLPVTLVIPENLTLRERMFLVAEIEKGQEIHRNLPEIYSLGIPFKHNFTEDTITIQPNKTITFQSKVQTKKDKDYIAIIETQWDEISSVNKKCYTFLAVKATQK